MIILTKEQRSALKQIYGRIDDRRRYCKRCGKCCKAGIQMTYVEFAYLAEVLDGSKIFGNVGKCPFFNLDEWECSVYERRPWICRIYGLPSKPDRILGITPKFDLRRLDTGECCALTTKHNVNIAKRIVKLNKEIAPIKYRKVDKSIDYWLLLSEDL